MRLLLIVVVMALACGGAQRGGPASSGRGAALLAHVPADTPYLFGALEPIQPVLRDFMLRGAERQINQLIAMSDQLGADRDELPAWMQAAFVIVDEFRGKPASAWWGSLGLDPNARFVIYGLGLWPVLRLEVADAAKLRSIVDKVFVAGKVRPTVGTVEGQKYWSTRLGATTALAAVVDGRDAQPPMLVAAVIPTATLAATLPQIVGSQRPATPIAAGTLTELTNRHHLMSFMVAMIDSRRVVASLTRPSNDFDREMTRNLGPVDAACRADLDRLAATFPRLVFGYRSIDTKKFDAALAVEAPASITGGLAKLHAQVPGVVHSHPADALVAFGAAVDFDQLATWAGGVARGLRDRPFRCAWFDWINEGAAWLDNTLNATPMLSLWRGWRGFNVTIDSVDIDARLLTGDAIVLGSHAADVVNKAAGLVPALGALQLRPDGKPTELPVGLLGIPWLSSAHVALEPNRLAVAFGDGSGTRVRSRLAARPPVRSPLFMFYADGQRLDDIFTKLGTKQTSTELGPFTMYLDVTESAIELDVTGNWKP